MNLFPNRIICPETGEDITDEVAAVLKDEAKMKIIEAMREQRRAEKIRRTCRVMRDSKGNAVGVQKAFIPSEYYFAVMAARKRENTYLREHDVNTWEDEEFLKWELKQNPAMQARVEKETRYFQTSNKGLECPLFDAHGRVLP